MPEAEDPWQRLVHGLREGNRPLIQEFCERYGTPLQQLADKHLPEGLRRRVGAEDVVQSACRSFLRRARAGEFQLADSESLWRLLCAITLTKVHEQARFHRRQKRSLDREVSLTSICSGGVPGDFDVVDPRPSPAEAAEFQDQFEQLMASFEDEERRLVDLKLQQCTNLEVAARLGCSERTIRRLLKRVQARLERAFPAHEP
jgi:RNA polymerase sigma-70 factor (ECF subfamily)